MKADTENHSGSESSSSSGSDVDLNQSTSGGYATTTTSSSSLQLLQTSSSSSATPTTTTSNNGYYNNQTQQRTMGQGNGNQGFSLNTHVGNTHGAVGGMHMRTSQHHHFSPHNHQDSRGFYLGGPTGYHASMSQSGSPNEQDPFRHHHHHHHQQEDPTTKKREIRLIKNREAARECRRKKKEYIKCLENRVAVLENQNKALIEELKSLKELYTGKSFVQPKSEINL